MTQYDTVALQAFIPHRYPMLLVDKVDVIAPFEHAVGIKAVSMNEWFFQGHFPGHPIMPGVLIVEAMAQTAGVLMASSIPDVASGQQPAPPMYFMTMESVKFRAPVMPGSLLIMDVHVVQKRRQMAKFSAKAHVGETLTTEAEFMAMMDI